MVASARIVDLRQRYTETPNRFYAPLANEYRKVGDLDQAIALCRQHLAEAPRSLSGQIVFGQALFEAGVYGEARAAFLAAVELDPENVIAVRHLGDIARLGDERDAAVAWYQRLLDLDPRSAEPADLLREAREALGAGVPPIEVESPPPALVVDAFGLAGPMPDRPDGAAALATEQPVLPDPLLDPTAAPMVDAFAADAPLELERAFEPPTVSVPPSVAELMVTSVADDVPDDWGTATDDRFDAFAPPPVVPVVDFGVVDLDRPNGGADDTLISDDWASWGDVVPMEGEGAAIDVPLPTVIAADAEPESAADRGSVASDDSAVHLARDADPVLDADPAELQSTAPFATETMAALYLRQGLRSEAVAVYRQLLERRPDDAALRARLAEIETPTAFTQHQGVPCTARAAFAGLAARRPRPRVRATVPAVSMASPDDQRAHLLAYAFGSPHAGAPAVVALGTATSLDPSRPDDDFQDWLSGLTGS